MPLVHRNLPSACIRRKNSARQYSLLHLRTTAAGISRENQSFSLPATLGSAPDIAQAVLRTKGVVLDSLVEDRLVAEAGRSKQREVIDQLRAAKQRYTQLSMEAPKDFSAEARQVERPNWRSELHKSNSLSPWPGKSAAWVTPDAP